MTIRVAITGFGRIGRNVLRAHYEGGKKHDVEIVAINAPGDLAIHAHLLKHDSCHGRFNADVQVEGTDTLIVNATASASSPRATRRRSPGENSTSTS